MLSEYQLKIADLYNISISNVKKLVPNFFNYEKYALHYEVYLSLLTTLLETRIKTKKNKSGIRI